MAILIGKETKVLVQAITGKSGSLQTKVMLDAGTKIVAGVTPGKGGQEVHGVPVYDYISEAKKEHDFDTVISFVPPAAAKDSCFEIRARRTRPLGFIGSSPGHPGQVDAHLRGPRDRRVRHPGV